MRELGLYLLDSGGEVRGVHPGLWHGHRVLGRSLWLLLEEGLEVWEITVGAWDLTSDIGGENGGGEVDIQIKTS